MIADVWASSDDEHIDQRRNLRSPPPSTTTKNFTRSSLIFIPKSKYLSSYFSLKKSNNQSFPPFLSFFFLVK